MAKGLTVFTGTGFAALAFAALLATVIIVPFVNFAKTKLQNQ